MEMAFVELCRQDGRGGRGVSRPYSIDDPHEALCPAVGVDRARRAFAGRRCDAVDRAYQQPSHPAQHGLGLAVLGREAVRPS